MDNFMKMYFELESDAWHGFSTESLWVEAVADGRYRIKNTPFYVKGVSLDDVVFADRVNQKLFYTKTSIYSGHSTYRLVIHKDSDFSQVWESLEKLGCSYESSTNGQPLFALDVPSDTDVHSVYDILEQSESREILSFEEGHCGHTVVN